MIAWLRYARHGDVERLEGEGWQVTAGLGPVHGFYAVLMIWDRAGDPPGAR